MLYPSSDRTALILCTTLLCMPFLRAPAAGAEAALTSADYDNEASLARILWEHALTPSAPGTKVHRAR
jgi:hypothetical protein